MSILENLFVTVLTINSIPMPQAVIDTITKRYNNTEEHKNWILVPVSILSHYFKGYNNENDIMLRFYFEANYMIFQPTKDTLAVKIK